MKSQNVIRILLMTLFIAAVAVPGCSRHDKRSQSSDLDHSDDLERISRELMLTKSQSRELEAFISNLEDKNVVVQKGHNIIDMVVLELGSDQFDGESVEQAVSTYLNEIEVMSRNVVSALSTFHDSLSEEQKVKLASHVKSKDLVLHRRHR